MARKEHFDASYREDVVLRDGTRARLRCVREADRELLRSGFARLSARSRHLRFLGPKADLSDHDLDDLLSLDGKDRLAIGAQELRSDGTEGGGLGIARFARLPGAPAVAEAAVTVLDEAQGKGLGTVLLLRLVAAARERGIECFHCEFEAGNQQIWHMIERAGPRTEVLDHGTVRAEVPLSPPRAHPRTPRRAAANRTKG